MFDQLAPRYDLANRVLSLGIDGVWRRQAIKALGDAAKGEVLDLCAGTMDLSIALVAAGATQVHAIDFSQKMLDVGKTRLPPGAPVRVQQGDARQIPLPDTSVDGVICAFGLRNVPGVEAAIAECARVLRPGGRLVVLDFFEPEGVVAKTLHATWNKRAVPVIGGWITGFREAYDYLGDSMEAFGTAESFAARATHYGISSTVRTMVPPVAALVIGKRIDDFGERPGTTAVVEELPTGQLDLDEDDEGA